MPGNRLVMVANVLRASPGPKPSGQLTTPGCRGSRGASARRATSTPARTDCHRKCGSNSSRLPKRRHPVAGGSRRRLTQVATPVAQAPMARSDTFRLCISTSQSTKKAAPRSRALRRGESSWGNASSATAAASGCLRMVATRHGHRLVAEHRHIQRRQENECQ